MSALREGDKVRVIDRQVTEEDRKENRYFPHMKGLVGTVDSIFNEQEIAIRVDLTTVPKVTEKVHKHSQDRMRKEFLDKISEEQKKILTDDELKFGVNFMILVRSEDVEKV